MTSLCVELAANLTSHYFSPTFYDVAVTTLPDYLAQTGVLVTRCPYPHDCGYLGLDIDADNDEMPDHWSGSWIQNSTTGAQGYGVGLVLNPHVVGDMVTCIYPAYAYTDYRRSNGCGPLDFDEMLSWRERIKAQATLLYRKYRYFPNIPWEQVPCSKLFRHETQFNSFTFLVDHNNFTWKSGMWFEMMTCEATILKHTCCYGHTEPDFRHGHLLAYAGDESWKPSEWNTTMAIVMKTIVEHPNQEGPYNEIVFQIPPDRRISNDMVQAVFYSVGYNMDEAREQARQFGGVPLLEFNPYYGPDDPLVFRCAEDDPEDDEQSNHRSNLPVASE
jgi:hypothetical protein